MEVRDDEVGVGLLQVGRRRAVHDARDAADDEHRDEADREHIAVFNWIDPPHMVTIQLKIFTPVGMAMSIVASENTESAIGPMPVENM